MQFRGPLTGLGEEELGAPFAEVASALTDAGITAVMEMAIPISKAGLTRNGTTPLEVLETNLPAITQLPCQAAHWHLVHTEAMTVAELSAIEASLIPQLEAGVALAAEHGFRFGIEHNEVQLQSFFNQPERVQTALDAVPNLHFVWDFNHAIADHVEIYKRLIPRISMLHISDTPLPETNHHLPLGLGNVPFEQYFALFRESGFSGAAILEIGGLPKSGGFGKDTDEALMDSLRRLQMAIHAAG